MNQARMSCSYNIKKNNVLGRYLEASKDIREGEIILQEKAVAVGPQINAKPVCFRCCSLINLAVIFCCNKCDVALLCSPSCKGILHSTKECEALKSIQLKKENFLEHPQIILPVRCMLLKIYDDIKWDSFIQLEAHLENRINTSIWHLHKLNVEKVLTDLKCVNDIDLKSNLVQKICGILDVNSFEIRLPMSDVVDVNYCLRGVFLNASLMAHDCTPNTHLSVDDDFVMTIRANRFIPATGTIFFNYANSLQASHERRRHLKEGKYFDCTCKRCTDTSEGGTNLSALLCTNCNIGEVLCTEPLKDVFKENWFCSCCSFLYRGILIKTTLTLCREKMRDLDYLEKAENVLDKLKFSLGPKHYLLLEIKQRIISLLSGAFSKRDLLRKIKLCEEILEVINVLERGISRDQAVISYELYIAKYALANAEYSNNEIKTKEYLSKLKEAECILKGALKYLLYEPRNSPEGRLAKRAMSDLHIVRSTMKDIKKF